MPSNKTNSAANPGRVRIPLAILEATSVIAALLLGGLGRPGAERPRCRPQPPPLQRQPRRAYHFLGRARPGPVRLPGHLGGTGPGFSLLQELQRGQPGERVPQRREAVHHPHRADQGGDLQGHGPRPVHQRRPGQRPLERPVDGRRHRPGQGRSAGGPHRPHRGTGGPRQRDPHLDAPSRGTVTGYRVLRGTDANSLSAIAQDTGSAGAEYTDSTVAAETTYYYAALALSPDGDGARSATASATTPAEPGSKRGEDNPPPDRVTRTRATPPAYLRLRRRTRSGSRGC